MTLPPLISAAEVERRLFFIFPEGMERLTQCRSKAAARTIAASIYIGAIEGSGIYVGPAHIVRLSEEQIEERKKPEDRDLYRKKMQSEFAGWYNENSRETVRDDVIRETFLPNGAMIGRTDLPTTSGLPRYALQADFAKLFEPSLDDDAIEKLSADWREKSLSPAALARITLSHRSDGADGILVKLPDSTVIRLEPGPSSEIAKEVLERFAPAFLTKPALVWLSQSGTKVHYDNKQLISRLKIVIDEKKVLPDMILADLSEKFRLVFVEVVATDGPMTAKRISELSQIASGAGHDQANVMFVTAFKDRNDRAFKKVFESIAWGTMIWFSTEPEAILIMRSGNEEDLKLVAKG